jgi:uncharacterized membrane protein YbhN (UPF0104 family)
MWHRLSWLLKLSLTAATVWYLSRTVDLPAAWTLGTTLTPGVWLLVLVVMAAHVIICAARWGLVVRALGGHLPFHQALTISFIGNFLGQVLPGGIGGDAVRVWQAHVASGLSLSAAFNSVALDRLVTVFGLLLLVTVSEPLLPAERTTLVSAWVFPAMATAGLIGLIGLTVLDLNWLPPRVRRLKLVAGVDVLMLHSRRLLLSSRYAAAVLGLTVLAHLVLAVAVWLLGSGLGARISVLDSVVLFLQAFLVAMLPISVAGWGVRETAMIVLFGTIGVTSIQTTAMSVLFGISVIVVALPGGVLWLWPGKRDTLPGPR